MKGDGVGCSVAMLAMCGVAEVKLRDVEEYVMCMAWVDLPFQLRGGLPLCSHPGYH